MFVWEKNLFLYHFWVLKEIFRIFILNIFPESYQYCFLGVSMNVFSKVFLFKNIKFSFSISQKCWKFSISSEIFSKGLPQLLSPNEQSQLLFSRVKDKFLLIFGLWTKKVASCPFSRQVRKICSPSVRMNCLIIWRTLFPGRIFYFLGQ